MIGTKACPGPRSGIASRNAQNRRKAVAAFVIPAKAGIQRGGVGPARHAPKWFQQVAPFSFVGVPAQAGMSDCYENKATRPQACPQSTAPALVVQAPGSSLRPSIRHSGESRNPGAGSGWKCSAALVTRPVGEQPAHSTIPCPSHLRIIDTQPRYSGESRNLEAWEGNSVYDFLFISRSAGANRHE